MPPSLGTAGSGPCSEGRGWPRAVAPSPQTPASSFLPAKWPPFLHQMPSPTWKEHRLSSDPASPARPGGRFRICMALGALLSSPSLLGDPALSCCHHHRLPHACVMLVSLTLPISPRHTHIFIQRPSLTHLFPGIFTGNPDSALCSPSHSSLPWGPPLGLQEDGRTLESRALLPSGLHTTEDLAAKAFY